MVTMAEKILLVDDDAAFRSEFKDFLEGYSVAEAGDAKEALEILKKPNDIDLILLDIRLPGMDGLTLLQKIKEAAPDPSVVILTGHSSKDVAIKALKLHADDYLEKPLDVLKAKDVIERLLESRQGADDIASASIAQKIEKVKRFTQRNCHRKVSLADAAEAVCMCAKYLSRTFKRHTGMEFGEFRLQAKMARAKSLLLDTGYNVDQIAEKLGYLNTESFIRQFKKLTGLTPKKFRKAPRPTNGRRPAKRAKARVPRRA